MDYSPEELEQEIFTLNQVVNMPAKQGASNANKKSTRNQNVQQQQQPALARA